MGTKTTAKDMITITGDILNDIELFQNHEEKSRSLERTANLDISYKPEYSRAKKIVEDDILRITNNLKKLTEFAYTEERVEQVIKQIIERTKADVIKLIQADEAFTKDEKKAIELLQQVHSIISKQGIVMHSILEISRPIYNLHGLLKKDADIAEAVQIISRDLEKLMQTLRETEK